MQICYQRQRPCMYMSCKSAWRASLLLPEACKIIFGHVTCMRTRMLSYRHFFRHVLLNCAFIKFCMEDYNSGGIQQLGTNVIWSQQSLLKLRFWCRLQHLGDTCFLGKFGKKNKQFPTLWSHCNNDKVNFWKCNRQWSNAKRACSLSILMFFGEWWTKVCNYKLEREHQ